MNSVKEEISGVEEEMKGTMKAFTGEMLSLNRQLVSYTACEASRLPRDCGCVQEELKVQQQQTIDENKELDMYVWANCYVNFVISIHVSQAINWT